MMQSVCPKLPMRDKNLTLKYYVEQLGFQPAGSLSYPDYLMLCKEGVELHFFLFQDLDASENYGQVYIRVSAIHELYQQLLDHGVKIHPNGPLAKKPWGQWEFALIDPDNNLLTFGQAAG
jgi:uncharacterized glyoxalase superfamily protein PhnB